MSTNETSGRVSVFAKVVLVSFIILMILSYLVAMALGPLVFFFTESGSEIASRPIQLKFFLIGLPYPIPFEVNAGLGFISCWAIYVVAFFASYISGEKFHKVVKKHGTYRLGDFAKNFLFSMPVITSLLFSALVTLVLLQVTFGILSGPTIVSKEPSQLIMFFYLTYSPVTEEIGFRLIPIGLLTAVSLLIKARKNLGALRSKIGLLKMLLLGFLFPDKAKGIAGVKSVRKFGPFGGIAIYEWIVVLSTSTFFGLAHYYFGAWNVGKITTSSIFGVALALAYLIYGIHAPILMHWWFNYYFEAYFQASLLYPHVSWVSLVGLLWLIVLFSGAIGWMLISHGRRAQDWQAHKWQV